MKKYDVIIIGACHNGLVAASYLAKAGPKVLILETNNEVGGATTSEQVFEGVDARISRYSYLVSLLPDQILSDLDLKFETISRKISSYTPYLKNGKQAGLLVKRVWDQSNVESFKSLTNTEVESKAWYEFYDQVSKFAKVISPTLLKPLPTKSEIKSALADDQIWRMLIEQPLGKVLDERFEDDLVKGVILTDGLIGTFSSAYEMQTNICFLYHLIGNGSGEWKVPKGGMGELVLELDKKARSLGVEIKVNSKVVSVSATDSQVEVELAEGGMLL